MTFSSEGAGNPGSSSTTPLQSEAIRPGGSHTELSVVIPAFEEAEAIRSGKLGLVLAWAAARCPPAEVLVVDDGSRDGTAELAEAEGASVLRIHHGGKATALFHGIRAAKGRTVIVADMDQATPIGEASQVLAALEGGADIAIGSRGLRRPGAPGGRLLLSLGHWALRRVLAGLPWPDTQCGFKAFRRDSALEVLAGLRRYDAGAGGRLEGPCVSSGFDVEFLLVARRMGFCIAEVLVMWRYQETRRVAKVRDAWRGGKDLLAIAGHRLRGDYPKASSHTGAHAEPQGTSTRRIDHAVERLGR